MFLPKRLLATDNYATILIYHRFGDERYPSTSVSLQDFRKQMEYLKKNGYNVIHLRELYKIVSSGKAIPPKTVVITIDDGYRTTMKAFEILKEYRFPFTVFLYMEAVGRYPDFLTKEELEELQKSGLADFGNHLYSHPDLAVLRAKLSPKEYLKVLEKEEELSRKRFKELLGSEPEFFAFPYGSYDRLSVEFFKKKGYKLLLSQDRGSYSGKEDPIPRMAVVGSLSGFRNFVRNLQIEPLPVVSHYPEIGLLEENPVTVRFLLKEPEKYKNCSIYTSENGWVKAKKKGKVVESPFPLKIKRLKTRIGIRCFNRETGRKAEFFFLAINGEKPRRAGQRKD
ncbi:polysaccharide deacetylase [Phorcysia thermohydrogeniphila]|uniref:Polysaccharide deacetylase n=1 Tax=Phorcysia thermohydrogeniphila TaxID=936138 RepID=A0A4R1GHS7_9BACT|nr:polysaccharide deacetylase [Phorcysia thermohydrogeniphila]